MLSAVRRAQEIIAKQIRPTVSEAHFLDGPKTSEDRIRSEDPNEAVIEATSNKKLLGAPGIATRSKDATRGSWPYY